MNGKILCENESHLDQGEVEFVDKCLFLPHRDLLRSYLDSYTDDEVPDA